MNTETGIMNTDLTSSRKTYRFYPWIIVLLSAMFLVYKYIMQVSPSIMTHQLMREFHINGTGLGNLAATFFYTYFITQLFVGVLLDKLSPRLLSSAAIMTSAIGTYFFALSDSLVAAAIARGFMGIGAAFATVSYMKLTANWFEPRKFAFIGGLLATAAMVGAIFGQAPLAWLVSISGWRHSLVLCAWVGIIASLIFFIVVRDQPVTEISPYAKQANYRITLKDISGILSKKQNWLLALYSGLAFTPLNVFAGLWGNPFIMEAYHLSPTKTATLISSVFFGLALGAPVFGYLSDRLQVRRQVMIYGTILTLVSITSVIYIPHLPIGLAGLLLFLFGFGTGAYMLGFVIGKELNPIVLSATVIALINSADPIIGSFTEPMIGKFLDLNWDGKFEHGIHYFSVGDFQTAFLIIPFYLLIATVLVFFIRENR